MPLYLGFIVTHFVTFGKLPNYISIYKENITYLIVLMWEWIQVYWYPRCIKHFLTQLISSPLNSTRNKGQTWVSWSFYDDMLILDDHIDYNEDVDHYYLTRINIYTKYFPNWYSVKSLENKNKTFFSVISINLNIQGGKWIG